MIKGKMFGWVLVGSMMALALPQASRGSTAPQAFGTGVGNGTGDARTAYMDAMRRELGPTVVLSGGQSAYDQVYGWCDRISVVLKRELKRAQLQLQFNRYDLSVKNSL